MWEGQTYGFGYKEEMYQSGIILQSVIGTSESMAESN